MTEYRNEVREIERETRWTFFRFIPLFGVIIIVLGVVGFTLNSLGLIGKTAVERAVFEQSYQRSEAFKARIATDEAVLAEIEGKLSNPNLTADTRYNLKAQASAARLRIDAAKRSQ